VRAIVGKSRAVGHEERQPACIHICADVRPRMSASAAFRAFGGDHRAAGGQPWGMRFESEAAGGVKEGAREPAQLQAG
jgi:hypothetical protein